MQNKIIGIDPSLTNCGWGIIEIINNKITYIDSRNIKTTTSSPMAERLRLLHQELDLILKKYQPDICAIEEVFINNNPTSSLKLGHARGAIMLSSSLNSIPIYEYSPTKIKKSIVGNGRADKNQVKYMIKQLIPLNKAQTEHEFDALATALCHFFINPNLLTNE